MLITTSCSPIGRRTPIGSVSYLMANIVCLLSNISPPPFPGFDLCSQDIPSGVQKTWQVSKIFLMRTLPLHGSGKHVSGTGKQNFGILSSAGGLRQVESAPVVGKVLHCAVGKSCLSVTTLTCRANFERQNPKKHGFRRLPPVNYWDEPVGSIL